MEKWLFENLLELIVLVGGFLWAFIQLNRLVKDTQVWRSDMRKEHDKLIIDLNSHTESTIPHKSCPTHLVRMEDIIVRMSELQKDIREMRLEVGVSNKALTALLMETLRKT